MNGWAYRQVAGLGVLCVVIAWQLSKKYHVSVGLCFLVTSVYGLIQGGLPQYGSEVLTSVMALLFFSCIGLSLENEYFKMILPLLSIVALGDALIMLFRISPHLGELWGFMQAWWVMTNASLDACFIAIMSPVIGAVTENKLIKFFLLFFVFVAILVTKSNTALMVFLSTNTIVLLREKKFKSVGLVAVISIISIVPLYYFFGMKFAENYGRFGNWQTMMGFWKDNINHVLGSGPGTYWVYAQSLQAHKVGDVVFTWMHDDWLQVLFEQGYIGLVSVLFLYGMMIYKSFKQPILFSMVIGFGLISLTMYPLHLFFFQLIGVALIYHCFVKEEVQVELNA